MSEGLRMSELMQTWHRARTDYREAQLELGRIRA